MPKFTSLGVSKAAHTAVPDCTHVKKNEFTGTNTEIPLPLRPKIYLFTSKQTDQTKQKWACLWTLPETPSFYTPMPFRTAICVFHILLRQLKFHWLIWGALRRQQRGERERPSMAELSGLAQRLFNKTQRCSPPSDLWSSVSCRPIILALMSLLMLKDPLVPLQMKCLPAEPAALSLHIYYISL